MLTLHTQDTQHAQQKETLPAKTCEGVEPYNKKKVAGQMKTCGGYDCEFVEPPKSSLQTDCPICKLVLRDPYYTNCCDNSFCHSCIQQVQADHHSCPICRKEKFEVFPNKELKHLLDQLHILCTYSEDGCEWNGRLGELEHHLNEAVQLGES